MPARTNMSRPSCRARNTLKNLVNDILDLALVESGALRLELERIDLYDLLTDVATHAREWAAKIGPDAGTGLRARARACSWPMRAACARSCSIFSPMPSNSRRAAASSRCPAAIVGEDVQIAVADNGPGLAPDVKANVFERFSAKSQAGTRAGAGLGLALVNRFLELHDGWVEIESDKRHPGALPSAAPHRRQRPDRICEGLRAIPLRGPSPTDSNYKLAVRLIRQLTGSVLGHGDADDQAVQVGRHAQLAGQPAGRARRPGAKSSIVSSMSVLGGSAAAQAGST